MQKVGHNLFIFHWFFFPASVCRENIFKERPDIQINPQKVEGHLDQDQRAAG